jgi:uncharacterized OsmC-like protein
MVSPLEDLGYPLVFPVDEGVDGLDAPEPSLGVAHRTRVRSLGGMQKEALVTNSATGTTWRLASDEGEYLEGEDIAPAPLAHLTTGMVSSFASEVLTLADERGIEVEDLTLVQDNYYTMNGSALAGTMTAGALPVDLDVEIDADAEPQALRTLVDDAVQSAPVSGLIHDVTDSVFTLVANGREIDPDRVDERDGPTLPDPIETFESLPRDASERDPPIIHRTGATTEPLPDSDEAYTSGEGSSLSADQDRVLHLRGTCTVRPDGTKHVAVELFSPIGTVFEFISDEPSGRGGAGRAPDAMTYVAAGLGFCFMTQMGRYADIVDADLSAYRIVQDTHVTAGVRGDEATPAGWAPVETCAYVETSEDADFARELLDMSEQTCFLHALCRSDPGGPDLDVVAR